MIGGFLLFTVASIGCALANNIETLQLFRFLQALGGSAGPVLGRAIIRDIYTPPGKPPKSSPCWPASWPWHRRWPPLPWAA